MKGENPEKVLAQLKNLLNQNKNVKAEAEAAKETVESQAIVWDGPASMEKTPEEAVVENEETAVAAVVLKPVGHHDPSVWFVIMTFLVLASVLTYTVYALFSRPSQKKWASGNYTTISDELTNLMSVGRSHGGYYQREEYLAA